MPTGIIQADSLLDCVVTDRSLTGFLQMSDLKGVAVVSFSLIFGFVEFCSLPCHPRDRKQQDFIPLEMRRLSGASWRRMRKGMPVLSVENFYLSLKSSSELYRTRQGCSSLFWVKAQETCESFLLAFL